MTGDQKATPSDLPSLKTAVAPKAWFKGLVLLFVFVYMAGTALFLAPPFPVRNMISGPLIATWHLLGWGQGWSVFAPNLRRFNPHSTATITFADGSTRLYEFPRMEKMEPAEKFFRDKWRKFCVDVMPWQNLEGCREDIARYIARQCFTDKNNPPLQVALTVHWAQVPDLPTFTPCDSFPEHDKALSFFIYRVRKKDLES